MLDARNVDTRNGIGGANWPVRRLHFSVVPVSTTIEIERPRPAALRTAEDDSETMTVELRAWPQGPRCLVWVGIQVEAAWDDYRAGMREEQARREAAGEIVADEATGAVIYTGPTHIMTQIHATLRRDLLCAVVEDLSREEAGLLVHQAGDWEEILLALGWWVRRTEQTADGDESADPEAAAGAGATDASSPA